MRLIDLTLPLSHGMAVYPGDPPVTVRPVQGLESHGWRLSAIAMGSHAGTHVNAPWHMAPQGAKLEELPLERFVRRAVVRGAGPVPPGVGLVYADFPLGADELPLVLAASPPFVAQSAAFPMELEVERALCLAGVVSFENLANTRALPRDRDFLFLGLPLAVPGDGAPVRAVALVDERSGDRSEAAG